VQQQLRLSPGTDSSVSVYALHPGLVRTEFFRNYPCYQRCVIAPVTWLASKEPWYGAQTSIFCAVDDSVDADSGKYYRSVPLSLCGAATRFRAGFKTASHIVSG